MLMLNDSNNCPFAKAEDVLLRMCEVTIQEKSRCAGTFVQGQAGF